MKKFCLSALLAAVLMLPCAAQAETMGVYVAPKFVLNVQHAKGEVAGFGSASQTEASAGGAIAIGYDFAPKFNVPVRAELEYGAYGNVSKDVNVAFEGFDSEVAGKGEVKVGLQTLLANVYWDITTWNNFTPYVGAGIGLAFVKTKVNYDLEATIAGEAAAYLGVAGDYAISGAPSNTETVFAGQIGFGCSYAFTENISADFGYRFLMMGDGEAEQYGVKLETTDNYAHQIMMGVRVTF